MTSELQRAMARYEEARIRYRKAVLASLHGASSGEAIRQAITAFQDASADLKRLTMTDVDPPRTKPAEEGGGTPGWSFVLRLLKVGYG
jgi:hypothetical protein